MTQHLRTVSQVSNQHNGNHTTAVAPTHRRTTEVIFHQSYSFSLTLYKTHAFSAFSFFLFYLYFLPFLPNPPLQSLTHAHPLSPLYSFYLALSPLLSFSLFLSFSLTLFFRRSLMPLCCQSTSNPHARRCSDTYLHQFPDIIHNSSGVAGAALDVARRTSYS